VKPTKKEEALKNKPKTEEAETKGAKPDSLIDVLRKETMDLVQAAVKHEQFSEGSDLLAAHLELSPGALRDAFMGRTILCDSRLEKLRQFSNNQ
jgi:hypothetical protein